MARQALRLIQGGIQLDTEEAARLPVWGNEPIETLRREHFLILRAAGEGIFGLDLEGRAIFVNPAAATMTGHAVEELLGRRMHDVLHHSHPDGSRYEACSCPIYAAIRDGIVRKAEHEAFWRKDGTSFDVEYTSTPIVEGGRVIGAVVVFRDVSARHHTEQRLRQALDELRELKRRVREPREAARPPAPERADSLLGTSASMARVLDLVRRAAATDVPVLVQGETGTGKELVSRAIHELGRPERPFVAVNCAAIAASLVESELFGHERGAFTGADARRIGKFEQAGEGTLFLDEVGEMTLDGQAKLLRVLQERSFQRVGGDRELRTGARIVAATNRDLRELVAAGRFRADLYYRLNVLPITVPALRERRDDIPLLAESFRRRGEARWGRSSGGFEPASLAALTAYAWPGNVRELEHTIERAVLLCDDGRLTVELPGPASSGLVPGSPAGLSSLEAVEREHIARVLESVGHRISGPRGAAVRLGMHPNTLRYRIAKLGLSRPG